MTDKKFMTLTIVGAFVILIGAYLFLSKGNTESNKQQTIIASYSTTDKEKPQAVVEEDSVDLGTIKVSEQQTQDFTLKNEGNKPLQLSNITSSCGCTVGQVIYEGKTSAEFGMHSLSDEIFDIAPNQEAIIRVIYRPYVMPVSGVVEREVYIDTNDPVNQKLVFTVIANVQ